MAENSDTQFVVERAEVHGFVKRCFTTAGMRDEHADVLAELIAEADYRSHYSHGLNRLGMYLNDIKRKEFCCDKDPVVLKESPATAWVDGNNITGPVVGKFCMDLAIQKAKAVGIGWVCAKGSNHFGIAGWYSMRALEHGLIGMSFTNTSPVVVPTRSKEQICGTNPISVAAPAKDGDSFVLDMATSTVSLGKVEIAHLEGRQIPKGWGTDKDGQETLDPKVVLNKGGLMPLGGIEESGGYKGYGLGMMVELFTGILGGAMYGRNIRHWALGSEPANLGHCFAAINPAMFSDGFPDRMSDFMSMARNSEQASDAPVLVPGDPERQHMKTCDDLGGVPYHPNQIKTANGIAEQLKVAPINVIKTINTKK